MLGLKEPLVKRIGRRFFITLLAVYVAIGVAACGDGSGGGADDTGSSQSKDPVVVDYGIAYIKRSIPRMASGVIEPADVFRLDAFNPGAALYLRDRASSNADERDITSAAFDDSYDVKDLNVSSDGVQLLFAMRAPDIEGLDDDEQPSWNIWLYDSALNTLNRVITSDISSEVGDDISPAFLPDGRIVFSSTRQQRARALLLDDNKPQYSGLTEDLNSAAFTLHVMDSDGTNVEQITYNQSHDLQPIVLQDGRILFNRWDRFGGNNQLSLYTVFPDGSGVARYYGYHSQNTGSNQSPAVFFQPRQMPDDRILVSLRPRESSNFGGDIVLVDGAQYAEAYSEPGEQGTIVGQSSIAISEILVDGGISTAGRFNTAYPFYDGTPRLLVSWSQCRLLEPDTQLIRPCTETWLSVADIEESEPLYGLWIYNYEAKTQIPIVTPTEGFMVVEGVTMAPRDEPAFFPKKIPGIDIDADLVDASVGVLHIRSVYDLDGVDTSTQGIASLADPAQTNAADRTARFLRIVKAVAIPDRNTRNFDRSAFGRSRNQLMREIIGYTPIQPDGSVRVKIPADIAFTISVLDADGKRIGNRHQNWLQLRAGEVRECSGCHNRTSEIPHGRSDMEEASINTGAPTSGLAFPNTEPALFANMGETMAETMSRIAGTPSLTGGLDYLDVWTDPLVRAKDAPIDIPYSDLNTAAPISATCQTQWDASCRSVINYTQHIQPIWQETRLLLDNMGALIEDRTCSGCHSDRDNANMPRVPLGQLNLSADQSPTNNNYAISYVELLFNDNEQEVVDGAIIDRLIQATDNNGNPRFLLDNNGDLVLDANGDPIPVMVTVGVPSSMSTAGAGASRFFDNFANGGVHDGYLHEAELKLLSEWLDVGAQYYNNPFDAPLN